MSIKMIGRRIFIAWRAFFSDHVILITMEEKELEGMMTEESGSSSIFINSVGHVRYTQMRVLQGVYDSYVEPNIEKEAALFLEEAEKIENQ